MNQILKIAVVSFAAGVAVGAYLMSAQQKQRAEKAEVDYWRGENQRLDRKWGRPEAQDLLEQVFGDE